MADRIEEVFADGAARLEAAADVLDVLDRLRLVVDERDERVKKARDVAPLEDDRAAALAALGVKAKRLADLLNAGPLDRGGRVEWAGETGVSWPDVLRKVAVNIVGHDKVRGILDAAGGRKRKWKTVAEQTPKAEMLASARENLNIALANEGLQPRRGLANKQEGQGTPSETAANPKSKDAPPHDGPAPGCVIWWKGKDYTFTPLQWRILSYMWDRNSADKSELANKAWVNAEDGVENKTISGALAKLNGRLLDFKLPWQFRQKDGSVLKDTK
ncbi:MAG TPA: hypothetical protein P5137_08020 [Candidatus Brocadiia bacterium]|nr:hypothetical protein [Candidatus Brocadiia bacterium]